MRFRILIIDTDARCLDGSYEMSFNTIEEAREYCNKKTISFESHVLDTYSVTKYYQELEKKKEADE